MTTTKGHLLNLNRRNISRIAAVFLTAFVIGLLVAPKTDAATATPSWVPADLAEGFDPSTGFFNLTDENTAQTRASLVDAATTPVNHVFVGDSITAGWNKLDPITLQGTINRDQTIPYFYRRALTSSLGLPAGGTGLVRAFELINPAGKTYYDTRWTPGPNGIGVQAKGHYISATNSTVTFDSGKTGYTKVAGNNAALVYFDSGSFTIAVDSGKAVSVKGTGTGQIRRYEINNLPLTSHKLIIKASGSAVRIIGAEVYSDAGIQASNIAQGGSKATGGGQKDWSVSGSPMTQMSPLFSNDAVYSTKPSTVFIELGGNDLKNNANNLGAVRDGILETAKQYEGSDIVLISVAQGSKQFTKVDVKPLLTMLYQLAAERDWPLWDMQYITGGYDGLAAKKMTGDTYGHLTPAGYKWLADQLAGAFTKEN